MKLGTLTLAASLLLIVTTPAIAYDRGDTAYICFERKASNKMLWGLFGGGKAVFDACRVIILEKAGSRYRVELDQSCQVAGNLALGEKTWSTKHTLYATRADCED